MLLVCFARVVDVDDVVVARSCRRVAVTTPARLEDNAVLCNDLSRHVPTFAVADDRVTVDAAPGEERVLANLEGADLRAVGPDHPVQLSRCVLKAEQRQEPAEETFGVEIRS